MNDNIRNVAVIGAGISGVCTAAHLLRHGLSVTVYERMSVAGGVWHFDERSGHEQRYPNEIPSRGDYERLEIKDEDVYGTPPGTPKQRKHSDQNDSKSQHDLNALHPTYLSIAHSSPGPCYAGLKNNVSLPAMKTTLGDWPAGLEDFVNQRYLESYIQQIAKDHNVERKTRYNTRVEDIRKVGNKWRVSTSTFVQQKPTSARLDKSIAFFDAVVVASGHYHVPRIPSIPGLKEWKELFPNRVQHSKGYRNANKYRGANVLLIGAGVSSMDIAKEITEVGGHVYQSSRDGKFDIPASSLPQGATRVAGVKSLAIDGQYQNQKLNPSASEDEQQNLTPLQDNDQSSPPPSPIPGHVTLTDNSTLHNLTHIILATGYITSYPFLPQFHADDTPNHLLSSQNLPHLVAAEGNMVHNLHREIFYIPDPTLSFVGIPYHISTFSLFDFQAQVVARVYSSWGRGGGAKLPSEEEMWAEYKGRVKERGLGREFHSLRGEGMEIGYVRDLVEWVNGGGDGRGDEQGGGANGREPMRGHTEEWFVAHRKQREMLAKRFGVEILGGWGSQGPNGQVVGGAAT